MSKRIFHLALVLLCLTATAACAQHRGGGGHPGGAGMGGFGGRGGGAAEAGPRMGRQSHEPGQFERRQSRTFANAPMRSGPQLGLPGRWWDDRHVVKNLSLRPEQQHRMDDIFEAGRGQLVAAYSNLKQQEKQLNSMSNQQLQDENAVFANIDRVAQARAELAKTRARIMLQIRNELDNDQLSRLDHEIANSQ